MESGGSSRPRSGARQSQASGPPRNPRWQVGWFSPAPPSAFDRHRSGALEDITKSLASGWRTTRRRQLREPFPTVRARLAAHPSLLLRSVRTRAGPLAATAGAEAPTGTGTLPLLGFVTLVAPPPTHPPRVHSQRPELPRVAFGPTAPPVQLPFRPRGFTPPRRLSPREGPRACCIPLPVLGFTAFPETRSPRSPDPTTEVAASEAGVRQASLPAARSLPLEEFSPPTAVPCHHGLCPLAVVAPPGGSAPRSPLPVGGSGAVRRNPSTSRRCSANGSVASDTLSGAGIARSFHGLVSPSWSDFLRSLPGLSRGDPQTRKPASGRPSQRRRIAVLEPRTSLPSGSAEAAAGVCPEGPAHRPKTMPTTLGFSTLKERSEERFLGRPRSRGRHV
jgi:hypothetical protein